MKFLTEKGIVQKIVIAIVFVLLFNFMMPSISAATNQGGILFEPIKDLLLVIADGIMAVTQSLLYGSNLSTSFLTIQHQDSWLASFAGIGTGILTAVGLVAAVVAAPFTGGLSLGVVVGIAATSVGVGYAVTQVTANAIPPTFKLPMFLLTPEAMFSNEVPLLDVNFFTDSREGLVTETTTDAEGNKIEERYVVVTTQTGQQMKMKSTALELQPIISQWYYALRNLAIVALLSILVYIGIRILISSSAEDKAKYKQRLMDWLVAMCLLFFMHYIMAFAVSLTEEITKAVNSANDPYYITFGDSTSKLQDYKYDNGAGESEGEKIFDTDSELANTLRENSIIVNADGSKADGTQTEIFMWPTNLTGRARIELQLEPTDNLTGDDIAIRQFGYTVIYLALVLYTMLFLFRYIKRLLMLAFLTIIAPLMAMTYPLDKMRDGSAQGFNTWLKEYLFNLLIQPVHLILYTVLIGSAIDLVADNIIYALVALGFMLQAEKILRKFFGFDKASTVESGSALGGALAMHGINQIGKFLGRGRKDAKGSKESQGSGGNKQVRTADKGKNINQLFDRAYSDQENNDGNTNNSGNNSGAQVEEQKTPQQRMLDAYDEGFGTDSYDPAEREVMAREAYQPEGKNYSEEEYRNILRDSGYTEDEINDMVNKDPRYANTQSQSDNTTSELEQNSMPIVMESQEKTDGSQPKPKRNIKNVAKGIGAVAGKGALAAGKYVVKKAPRVALGGLLAGTAGIAGMTAGLVSDDFSNVSKWGAAGAGVGWLAGSGVASRAQRLAQSGSNALENAVSTYTTAAYGADAEKARQQAKMDEEFIKDKTIREKYKNKLKLSSKKEVDEVMEQAKKYRQYGVTDDNIIIDSMKADSRDFGEKRDSDKRLILAKLATEVGEDKKQLEQVEKGLRKRKIDEKEIQKYSRAIRDMNNWS